MVVDSTLACTSTRRMVSGTIVSFLAVLLFDRGKKVVAHSSRPLQACWHQCLRSRRRLKPIISPELIGSQSRRLAQAIPCYLFSVIIRLAMLFHAGSFSCLSRSGICKLPQRDSEPAWRVFARRNKFSSQKLTSCLSQSRLMHLHSYWPEVAK